MTVRDMIEAELRRCGFDGLFNEDCACLIGDLAPCDENPLDCQAGYKVDGCAVGGSCDFHVAPQKPEPGEVAP